MMGGTITVAVTALEMPHYEVHTCRGIRCRPQDVVETGNQLRYAD